MMVKLQVLKLQKNLASFTPLMLDPPIHWSKSLQNLLEESN